MLNIKRFTFNPFAENSYIVWDSETNDAAVVDPGCYDHEERNEIGNFIKSNSLKLKYLILTHCHLDHIFGSCYIKTNFDVTYYAPEEDIPLLKQASQQASMFGLEILEICLPDKFIKDDLELNLGKIKIEFLFTPGHTPGGYCLYFRDQNICITGDVLFDGSIGRTDLPGGNYDQIIKSVREKLLVLPKDTKVYPGHGEMTTIGKEIKYNPFFTDK